MALPRIRTLALFAASAPCAAACALPADDTVRSGAGDGGGSTLECPGPGFADEAAPGVPFTSLAATVVDDLGSPLRELRAQACGINICLNGTSDASGRVSIVKDVSLTKPAFKYGDGTTYAKFALPLEGPSIDVDLGEQVTVAFPPPSEGAPLSAGTDATSGGVTLTLPADLVPVDPDPFDYDTPELRLFRAASVPASAFPDAVEPSLGFEIVVALTPSGTELCPAARMAVDNTPGWAPDAAVEFFLHGVEVEEEWAPYGGWAKVSDGAVSADGGRIETAAGGGLPALSVVGIRLAR